MRTATVRTARPQSAKMKAKIIDAIKAKIGDAEIFFEIDDSLIGGIVIDYDSNRFDASIKSNIDSAKEDMLSCEDEDLSHITTALQDKIKELSISMTVGQTGKIIACHDSIVFVDGLTEVKYGELIKVGTGYAMVQSLEENRVGAVLLTDSHNAKSGEVVFATGRVVDVPVGEALLGRIVNPLGTPIDDAGRIKASDYRPIENPAPEIMNRDSVTRTLETGIKAIDAMVPIGKGQRELIIGDRQTGKTAIAVDTILSQKGKDVYCVYVSIGQKDSTTAKLVATLKEHGADKYTVVVSASASATAAMQYIAPYTGCAIAEYFMYSGKDVLIVYDDLTKHAMAYRTLSLLLGRPSGREAYPGDIFYSHSRLLERAAQLSAQLGGGSMTALPIIETQLGDLTSYIPTNVISITDGQLFLESELFHAGIMPAINVGLSVSRVGGSAQWKGMRKVSGKLRLDLAHYRELAVFTQFASDLEYETKKILSQGEILTRALCQGEHRIMSISDQIVSLYVLNHELIDFTAENVNEKMSKFLTFFNANYVDTVKNIKDSKDLTTESIDAITAAAHKFAA